MCCQTNITFFYLSKSLLILCFRERQLIHYVVWAGLLTCFGFLSFPFFIKISGTIVKSPLAKLTAAGLLPICTAFPFNLSARTKTNGKGSNIFLFYTKKL
jgi:hypothetical protein